MEAGLILTVGLTGGIASGKSTILRLLGERGCRTIDADQIVRWLYEPGRAGHEAVVREYGAGMLDADGRIDRSALASAAFASPAGAARLNALIHPLVLAEEKRRLDEARQSGEDSIHVVEATLLLESGGRDRYDRIVVVDVDPEVQVARGVARGMAREEILRRIAHQMPRADRLRQADYVIDNSGSAMEAGAQVDGLVAALRQDLAQLKEKAPGRDPGAG